MLFIVNHKHTAETCPAGKIHHDDNFMQNLDTQIKKTGLKFVEGYLDAPGHQFYFVIDADSPGQIFESFGTTLNSIGETRVVPVLKWSDAMVLGQKVGVQK